MMFPKLMIVSCVEAAMSARLHMTMPGHGRCSTRPTETAALQPRQPRGDRWERDQDPEHPGVRAACLTF